MFSTSVVVRPHANQRRRIENCSRRATKVGNGERGEGAVAGETENGLEPLLAGTAVRLFGRLVAGITIDLEAAAGSLGAALARLKSPVPDDAPGLARVYGFSYEGQYYDLARPALYLVHGQGIDLDEATPAQTGIAAEPPTLAPDMKVWAYDPADFSLRLSFEVGPLERILLEAELEPDQPRLAYAGQKVRGGFAGPDARLRYAGQKVHLRGGRGGGLSD
jgi:hypothetical protein